jgi:hypothetical protein
MFDLEAGDYAILPHGGGILAHFYCEEEIERHDNPLTERGKNALTLIVKNNTIRMQGVIT